MPDVHLPKVHSASFWHLLLEVVLISVGVFLGLAGEQWRQAAEHRELARQSLQRFASEIQTNHVAVDAVKDYHANMKATLEKYFAADMKGRTAMSITFNGIRPVQFEHSAWDLAVATQALVYTDPETAAELSRIYTKQAEYALLSNGILQALYTPQNALALVGGQQAAGDVNGFFAAVAIYYDDLSLMEPELDTMYEKVLPRLDSTMRK